MTLELGESVELGRVGARVGRQRLPRIGQADDRLGEPEDVGERFARVEGSKEQPDRLEREPLVLEPQDGQEADSVRLPVDPGAATQRGWGSRPSVCRERMRRVVVSAATANWSIVISSRELGDGAHLTSMT